MDAAAEILTIPNVHLQNGATAVAYSGGKCIRGPQAAGLLLGERNLLQAAWLNSAPHHAFGRSLKVGKEEIMGMLAAVEMWVKRDHQAEWKQWEGWLETIAASMKKIDGVTTRVTQPGSLSNHSPTLIIQWDGARLGITGQELSKMLLDTEPRIILAGASGSRSGNLVFIAGVGAHYEGDIKAHTKTVLDQIQKNLESAGSSMEKVLKCNVYLNDLKDYAGMNGLRPPAAFRATHWSRSTWSDIFDEAWVTGGNYVMSLGTRLRDALLKGIPDALAAWRTPRPGRS